MTPSVAQRIAENAAVYSRQRAELEAAVKNHNWDLVQDLASNLYLSKGYLETDGVDVTRL